MNNVIGPIDADSWYFMRQLRESTKDCLNRNPEKYKLAISSYRDLYKKELKQWV